MLTVGLTGGIASGKSHVRRRLASAGLPTIDLDLVSRAVMAPGGAAFSAVVGAFGREILDAFGAIDRRALGRVVFADAAARRRLESITHPLIRAEEQRLVTEAGGGIVVVDAALLVETGTHLRFDRLVVVYCEPQEQLCRLMARDGLSETAARARIDAQMAADDKREFGHFVIDASDSLAETDARADGVAAALRSLDTAGAAGRPIAAVRGYAMMERGPHDGPRGLAPWALADAICAAGMLDMTAVARALRPPHAGPWYEAAERTDPGAPPESLAVPIALWCAGRRPGDEAYTTAAAFSVARLTHRGRDATAGAIVAALAAQRALLGAEGRALREALPQWVSAAAAWAGAPPAASVTDTVLAAAAHPGDREAASRAAQLAGGLPPLARALAGGPAPAAVAAERLQCVARLLGRAAL